MSKQYYKFMYLNGEKTLASEHGNMRWRIGKEYSVEGKIVKCKNGLHASEQPMDALNYVHGDVLAIVEAWGDCDKDSDKVCYRSMKVVKAYKWTKTDSVTLAIYAAEQVIKIYEDKYPNDSRPRDAIKAAKAYLKDPSKKNRDAAANAAANAYAAANANAAYAAAYAAYAAANAAANAAAAAYATAAYAAANAYAAYAARKEMAAKINRKFKSIIKHLEEIQP